MQKSGAEGISVATGCFKCGRPGHWSRDCPLSPATNPNPNPNPNPNSNPNFASSKFPQRDPSAKPTATTKKKALKTRPKLTPDLLLSDDGLGYVLRHFPRSFKYHGRGHEVTDLGNLLGMYVQWHSHLIPYYSFDQFVHKVEKVGSTKRVKRCISELRERVARGGDPTKLHEPPVEQVAPDCEQEDRENGDLIADKIDPPLDDANDIQEGREIGDLIADNIDPPLENHDADDIHEDMFAEIYRNATEEPCEDSRNTTAPEVNANQIFLKETLNKSTGDASDNSTQVQITEEQKVRMRANRLKALERAAARSLNTPSDLHLSEI